MKRTMVLAVAFSAAFGLAGLGVSANASADDWSYGHGHHYTPAHYGHHRAVIVDYGHHYPSWSAGHGGFYGGHYIRPYHGGGYYGHGYYGGHRGGHISFGGHHARFNIHF